jgi:hypothetical protein
MTPKIAIATDYLDAFSALPQNIRKKAREFVEKFRRDPTSNAINYERIERARDPKVRSVRVDQCYRAIVVAPTAGDVYILVWVDKHDEAYRWAEKRVFEVNARGAVEVYQVADGEMAAPPAEQTRPGLLHSYSDQELELLGVPRPLMPALRAVHSQEELDKLTGYLPATAADGVLSLVAGYSLDQVLEELTRAPEEAATPTPAPVNSDDFLAALQHPESQQTFHVIESEEDLAEILSAPLERWRIFLHPTQRRLAQQNFRGPARVLGGAGTGKTVVLMHRAAHLARKVFSAPTDRVLVTTYTRNLANDLLENLTRLCPDVVDRLEVTNLHRWASDFLASQGMRLKPAPESVTESLWNELLANTTDFTAGFYRQEWERVVQAHDCLTRDGYLAASRVGRGTRLSRPQRLQLWTLFESYRNALRERGLAEYADMVREARMLIEKSPGILPYRAVLADEVQDFRPADLKLLRALVPRGENDIFVVGDGHQRIYGHKASLGKAGIDIRGRSRNLRINYRTTQKIRNFAVRLLEGQTIDDLDGGVDDLRGYRSLREGVPPQVHLFKTPAQETACILERLAGWLADGVKPEEICLAARVNSQVEEYARQLQAAGHVVQKIEASGDKKLKPGFRIATMHRLKGLEFRALVLAGVQEGSVPFPLPHPDEASREDHLLGERCLLYVAATRARDLLCVTGHGGRSELLG